LLICYAAKKIAKKLGVSVKKWIFLGPFLLSLTPVLAILKELSQAQEDAIMKNRRAIDRDIRKIVKLLPIFIGGGLSYKDISTFLKAAENNFVYYDERGRYLYQLTPTEALLKMAGFTPLGLSVRRDITTKYYNADYLVTKAKRDIKDMYLSGRKAKARKNYYKFVRYYKEVYLPIYKQFVRSYGADYYRRIGKIPPLRDIIIDFDEFVGLREQ
jgi:hypothetical protein